MESPNLSIRANSTAAAPPRLNRGWVSQPDSRGTLDILESCLITIFLCSWSVLFLNLPAKRGWRAALLEKVRWMLFTIFFPEVLTAIAAEQWRSACQSVEDFSRLERQWESGVLPSEKASSAHENLARLRSTPWTMRHAFFADMGGLLLSCPDFAPFPIDSYQLVFLIEHGYLEYPDIKESDIWDKNKADGFARVLSLVQIAWFSVQSISRCAQHLALSTFELSTLAFIFCTMNSFFWRHKPLDAETPMVVQCSVSLEEIIVREGGQLGTEYSYTPLDFFRPMTSKTSLIAPFWFGLNAVFDWRKSKPELPVKTFGNRQTNPPRGLKVADIVFGNIFTLAYFGIHLAGWNFEFPSRTEQILWRVSSLTLLGLLIFYLFAVAFGTVMAGRLARKLFNNDEETTILGVASLLPRWVAVWLHAPFFFAYVLARGYIMVEGCVNLRALPATAFQTVDWWEFWPSFS